LTRKYLYNLVLKSSYRISKASVSRSRNLWMSESVNTVQFTFLRDLHQEHLLTPYTLHIKPTLRRRFEENMNIVSQEAMASIFINDCFHFDRINRFGRVQCSSQFGS
jgi:hypothetical protein